MRSLFLAYAGASMLAACSFNATGLSATTNLTGEDTTGAATTTASSTTDPTSGGATGDVCSPGVPAPCECPLGEGQHLCNPDGNSYGPCDCPDDPTSSSSSTTAVDPDTSAGTSTTGDPDTTSSTTGDPDTSSSGAESTSTSTTTTSDDTTSSESSSGDESSSTGDECVQTEMEPNDPVAMALSQAEVQCGQGKPGGQVMGVLDGDQDIDWFKYHGDYDSPACNNTNPTHVYSLTTDATARLCVFADCDMGSGTATVMCSVGQTVTDPMVPGGFGCCGTDDFTFEFNCDGSDDESSQVYMRLDSAKSETCTHYTVTFDYQDK